MSFKEKPTAKQYKIVMTSPNGNTVAFVNLTKQFSKVAGITENTTAEQVNDMVINKQTMIDYLYTLDMSIEEVEETQQVSIDNF